MGDAEIKEILEQFYDGNVPEGAFSLVREMRRRIAAFGPYEVTRKDVAMCAIMFDLYIKAKDSVKRATKPKGEPKEQSHE